MMSLWTLNVVRLQCESTLIFAVVVVLHIVAPQHLQHPAQTLFLMGSDQQMHVVGHQKKPPAPVYRRRVAFCF